MSCILKIGGENFDVDSFVLKSQLVPYKKSYKGAPLLENKPEGEKLLRSLICIETSSADFDSIETQIQDTINYLEKNRERLSHIKSTKEIEYAILDFAIELRIGNKNVVFQSDIFPNKLLKLAGDLGLDIELSIYPNNGEVE